MELLRFPLLSTGSLIGQLLKPLSSRIPLLNSALKASFMTNSSVMLNGPLILLTCLTRKQLNPLSSRPSSVTSLLIASWALFSKSAHLMAGFMEISFPQLLATGPLPLESSISPSQESLKSMGKMLLLMCILLAPTSTVSALRRPTRT